MGGHSNQPDLVEAARIREQAIELLRRLLADRAKLEVALAERGRRDAMKWVTGRSSLDNAIDVTRMSLRRIDQMLAYRNGADRDTVRRMREIAGDEFAAVAAPIGA